MPASKSDRPRLYRRAILGVAAAAPALWPDVASAKRSDEDLVDRCATFLAVDRRIERLDERWGDLETMAITVHKKWWNLREDQRKALPEGRKMAEIDQIIEGLLRERERLLKALPELATRGVDGLLGKLVVAARTIRPEDDPLGHGLLVHAARDLAHMRCPDCGRRLARERARRFVETLP